MLAPHLRPDSIDCEDAEIMVSRRIDGELAPQDLALLKTHLKGCANCRAQAEAWAETSCVLVDSISTLWTEENEAPVIRDLPKKLPTPRRGAYWLPLSMLASQAVAIVGLIAYLWFFAPSAEAPKMTERGPVTASIPAQKLPTPKLVDRRAEIAAELATITVQSADYHRITPFEPELIEVSAPAAQPVEVAPVVEAAPAEIQKSVEFAAPLPPVELKKIPNVSMDFEMGEQCGRVTLLGDILSGKAVIRISDSQGRTQDVAQQDVDTLLPQPQRTAVRHFLARCAEPALRARFEELRK
jgi:anti-sigma factor RsiW